MTSHFHLFEVCWEVLNGLGPLQGRIASDAQGLVDRLGDRYVTVGPWFARDAEDRAKDAFEPDAGFAAFEEACRESGVPVRVGRWRVAGRPRAILVDFAALQALEGQILSHLWRAHGVDSLSASREHVEAVLFGTAAALATARWWEGAEMRHPGGAVARFHDGSTAAGLVWLRERAPAIATVLTIHGPTAPAGRSLVSAAVREADVLEAADRPAAEEVRRSFGRRVDVTSESGVVAVCREALDRAVARRASGRDPVDLPASLAGLDRLARNLWWSWDAEAAALFEALSPDAWRRARHDPSRALREASVGELVARATDAAYVARLDATLARLDAYARAREGTAREAWDAPVAYVSAEIALHESLPVYAGGLGVLSGDHVKSASDANLPLVAVGLLYRKGRQRQRVTATGEQRLEAVTGDPRDWPVEAVGGLRRGLVVEIEGRRVALRAWRALAGRVEVYLLDADVEGNDPEDRSIAHLLYPSDPEARLRKEIVLGVGAVRCLAALGIEPRSWHLNEGHAALAPVERVTRLVAAGVPFEEARRRVRETTAFTTHTPVPAGHDRFDEALVERFLPDLPDAVFRLARGADGGAGFDMTRLAVAFSSHVNAVSRIHAEVTRKMFGPTTPVAAITNGVHLATWTAPEIAKVLGAEGRAVTGEDFARAAPSLDPAALWAARRPLRARLLDAARRRLDRCLVERRMTEDEHERAIEGLDERALLVGFARRFAAYKRADLLLRDAARLERILSSAERPVRVFFAGRAHPDDREGRAILARVANAARGGALAGRVYFLEDYGLDLARTMVRGSDVWLNNPRRGLEASGTSGMKAAANGALNVSTPDGWWPEAADGPSGSRENGWTIGTLASSDDGDAEALYALLENEVVPLFFDRDADGVPRRWLERVRRSLSTIPPVFHSDRMVSEYASTVYGSV